MPGDGGGRGGNLVEFDGAGGGFEGVGGGGGSFVELDEADE